MEILNKWWFKPAKYWQFWLPQSGIIGGMILGAFILAIIIVILSR